MKKRFDVLFVTRAAMIAAIYVVLTIFVNSFGLANGAIQVRVSEALCVLPIFTPAAIPGLFIGCFISNVITGCVIWDIVFGSLTTLCCAYITYKLRDTKLLYLLPPIIGNAIVVPFVLRYAYGIGDAIWYLVLTVGIGEIISVGLFGFALKKILWREKNRLFGVENDRANF